MWDPRGAGYYYRHVRVGGRPRRVYLGTGPAAERAAAEDDRRRAERLAQRQAREARAQAGASSALPSLRRLLTEHPEVWLDASELARRAEDALLELASADVVTREAIKLKLEVLREDLGLAVASLLERLLI